MLSMKSHISHLNKAIEICGGLKEFLIKLQEACPDETFIRNKVYNWRERDTKIPAQFGPAIEKITNGEITRRQVCPQIDW